MSTMEDLEGIVRVFAANGVGRCRSVHLAFPYLLETLYYGRDLSGADRVFELGQALQVASATTPFELLPTTLFSRAEEQRREMNDRFGIWAS